MEYESHSHNGIIKKESVLFSNYSEELFFKRDEEEKIISALQPMAEKKRCENIFAYGPTGTGKTPLVKYALNSIKNQSNSIICLYINCWHYSTSMAIYVKIADALGEPVSRRGRATDEIFDSILERMRSENLGVLLVLDDIEGLIYKNDTKILHNLARVANNCARFGVIGISEDKNILNKIDPKVLDSLRFIEVEIKGYPKEQLFEILKARACLGLVDGTYSLDILEKIADIGADNGGNGRLVLEILRRSAKKAEQESRSQIAMEDVEAISRWLCSRHTALNEEEQLVIDILRKGERSASEIYWLFCKKIIRSKRQIRNYLKALEMKGALESYFTTGGGNFGLKMFRLSDRWYHE